LAPSLQNIMSQKVGRVGMLIFSNFSITMIVI